jgi:phospholipase/lecithinase/hemolysin
VDCSIDNEVVLPAEYKAMRDAVAGYNAFVSAQATQRGWAYVDPNPTLAAYRADPTKIAPFPTLPSSPSQPNVLFGSFFSLDGVHPSAAAHRVIADTLISAINVKYATTIPFVGP